MSYSVEIQGTEYFAASAIARQVGYTPDYVTKLAREQKVKATRVGRQWFVDPYSLKQFINSVRVQKQMRSAELRRERRNELSDSVATRGPSLMQKAYTVADKAVRVVAPSAHRYAPQLHAAVQTGAIALSGVVLGVMIYGTSAESLIATGLRAVTATESATHELYVAVEKTHDTLPALSVESLQRGIRELFLSSISGMERFLAVMMSGDEHFDHPGVVVVPTSDDSVSDVHSIQESFSDEVNVTFDPDAPNTGVVTPVFKERSGDGYRFLMVPVRSP